MLNTMIVFRALIARGGDRDRRIASDHSETERRAFERALRRPVVLEEASA
jgi:hypothetical protein